MSNRTYIVSVIDTDMLMLFLYGMAAQHGLTISITVTPTVKWFVLRGKNKVHVTLSGDDSVLITIDVLVKRLFKVSIK